MRSFSCGERTTFALDDGLAGVLLHDVGDDSEDSGLLLAASMLSYSFVSMVKLRIFVC